MDAQARGRFANGWWELAHDNQLTSQTFICPASQDEAQRGPTFDAEIADLDNPAAHRCSYILAVGGLDPKTLPADAVLAFEPITNHDGAGLNVVTADGQYRWLDATADRALIAHLQADYAAGVRPLKLRP